MKKIFRSIIDVKKAGVPTIPPEELKRNYRAFLNSRIVPEENAHIELYHWIEAHFRDHDELPAIELLLERAQSDGNEQVLAALKDIAGQIPYWGSNYRQNLKDKFEEQSKEKFQEMLTNTWKVASSGLKVGKGRKEQEIKGLSSAIEYFQAESRKYRMQSLGVKTDGNIRSEDESKEVLDLYDRRRYESSIAKNMYLFLDKIDNSCRGIKPGELMIIAAFVGQAKSIFSANVVYNGIIQGLNGLYIPLEMTHGEMRDMFYTMHTGFIDWSDHPKYKNMTGKISYDKVCYGELSDLEYEFFKFAAKDFGSNPDFGELFIYQPQEHLTPSKLELKAYDVDAELKERGKQLDFLLVDYCGLMVADKADRYGDFNVDLNTILKRLKNLALQFDGGRMLRVITPFQTNRTGWKEAEKNDGIYKLTALSNSNEAERSGDIIISLYFTEDMKKAGIVKLACLKHRRGAGFPPFEATIDFQSKIVTDIIAKKTDSAIDGMMTELPLLAR